MLLNSVSEYRSNTVLSIHQYFEQNCEPFIKGLLRDKGGIEFSLSDLDSRMRQVIALMVQLISDYNYSYRNMPLYLYKKDQYTNGRLRCSLVWRVSRKICGRENTMVNRLFREDGRYNNLLAQFGPSMLQALKDYDRCRLILNTLYSTLNFQHKSVSQFQDAVGLMKE